MVLAAQVFVAVCFGVPALFLFAVGLTGFFNAARLASQDQPEGVFIPRLVTALGSFVAAGVVSALGLLVLT